MSKKADFRFGRFGRLAAAVLAFAALMASGLLGTPIRAHGFGSPITWNREISRLVYARCASCHRPGGTAFSLMTYADAQPRANEIKDAVLARRMPPWGAIKGFGEFRNDQSLTPEQIEMISSWVEGGVPEGEAKDLTANTEIPSMSLWELKPVENAITVAGETTLKRPVVVDGVAPDSVPYGSSLQLLAEVPGQGLVPLLWLYEYQSKFPHPYLYRTPLSLPSGARIHGIPPGVRIQLLPLNTK